MFKERFLGILLALFAIVFFPTLAVAQTVEEEPLFEDTSVEWDWGDTDSYETTYEYDDIEDMGAAIAAITAVVAIWGLILTPILLVNYIYSSLAYMTIAKKLNHPKPWFAWIPILRAVQRFQLAGMSGWFILLLLVPIANLVISILALMNTSERRGYDKLLGLLALIPIGNLVLIGILAWSENDKNSHKPQTPTQQPQDVNVQS